MFLYYPRRILHPINIFFQCRHEVIDTPTFIPIYTCTCRVYLTAEHSFAKPTHRIPIIHSPLYRKFRNNAVAGVGLYRTTYTICTRIYNMMHAPLSCAVSRPYYGFYEKAPVAISTFVLFHFKKRSSII